jgi:intraflagellar transport protein 140
VSLSNTDTHKSKITYLTWSPDGSKLITGDRDGLVVVWEGDNKRKLKTCCKYPKKGPITHLAFRAPEQGSFGSYLLTSCPPFFFYGGRSVYFADDKGKCADLVRNLPSLKTMYYSHSGGYLVLLTHDITLFKFRISEKGKMSQDKKVNYMHVYIDVLSLFSTCNTNTHIIYIHTHMQVKLSVKGDSRKFRCVWAGSGLLASVNNEGMVRVNNVENDDNYMLSLRDPMHSANLKDVIQCVSFNAHTSTLCGGCASGRVVFWRFVGHSQDSNSSSKEDWEILPSVETGGSVVNMAWGPGTGLLAVNLRDTCSVLSQTVLHTKSLNGTHIIQTSADSLFMQFQESKEGLQRIDSDLRIKGLELSSKYLVLWNGKQAEVRSLKNDAAAVVSTFNTKAVSIGANGDNLYCAVADTGRIVITNVQGVVKSSIAFPSSEGVPILISIKQSFMACATTKSVIKLWDIGRREPKALVPGRSFEEITGMLYHVGLSFSLFLCVCVCL